VQTSYDESTAPSMFVFLGALASGATPKTTGGFGAAFPTSDNEPAIYIVPTETTFQSGYVEWRAPFSSPATVSTVSVEIMLTFWEFVRDTSAHPTSWQVMAVSGRVDPDDSAMFVPVSSPIVTEVYTDDTEWRETGWLVGIALSHCMHSTSVR
jgi:hypothetical protein